MLYGSIKGMLIDDYLMFFAMVWRSIRIWTRKEDRRTNAVVVGIHGALNCGQNSHLHANESHQPSRSCCAHRREHQEATVWVKAGHHHRADPDVDSLGHQSMFAYHVQSIDVSLLSSVNFAKAGLTS
jgi:hypothetical protein